MALELPNSGRRASHARSVSRFCDEANIEMGDQLDLAEFIVAARYLGTEANDDQLMGIFLDMEETDTNDKEPKQIIKDLMKKVDEEYGTDLAGDDNKTNEGEHEVLAVNPLDAFAEDALWQNNQLDDLFTSSAQDQNIKIARNLLETTALTRHEIAEITGVDADLLKEYESDEYETDSEEEDDEPAATNTVALSGGGATTADVTSGNVGGVTIQATDFSKSVMLSKEDLGLLKEILDGGKDKVVEKSEGALRLLTKLSGGISASPGHKKREKTLAKLNLSKLNTDEKKEDNKEIKLPTKYRIVIHPGALMKEGKELTSKEVSKLPVGTVVTVEEMDGRRARLSTPKQGWCSLTASDGRVIMQRCNVKSTAMDKAIHAERARQTKVLILKSITTLNDATVTRILEKSDWNLRRAIEAFYIAKYKTQEYLQKKDNKLGGSGASVGGGGGNKTNANTKANASGGASPITDDKKKRKSKMGWWKSWKTFANEKN